MGLKTFGLTAVDWEQRVDMERLRTQRLGARQAAARASRSSARCCAST